MTKVKINVTQHTFSAHLVQLKILKRKRLFIFGQVLSFYLKRNLTLGIYAYH